MNTTPTDDQSCILLGEALLSGWPFHHAKFGDGIIDCMCNTVKWEKTADGERPWQDREAMAMHAGWIWDTLCEHSLHHTVYMGDWLTCSDPQGLDKIWQDMQTETSFRYVSYECLLLHRLTPELLNFYTLLRAYGGKKYILTSWPNHAAAKLLGAVFLPIPSPEGYRERSDVIAKRAAELVIDARPDLLLLAGGGIAASAQAYLIDAGFPGSTINLGSALDPLLRRGRTRRGQVDPAAARDYFRELL